MASTLQKLLKDKAEKEKTKLSEKEKEEPQVVPSSAKQSQQVPTSHISQQVPSTKQSQVVTTGTSPAIQNRFTKIPNDVIDKIEFPGLSKDTYLFFLKLTRAAINPAFKITISRREIYAKTGLSENTVRFHVQVLEAKGLLKFHNIKGKHEGSYYEVFLPGEYDPQVVPTSSTNQSQVVVTGSSHDSQNLVLGTSQEVVPLMTTNPVENKEDMDSVKLLYKDNIRNDDEAFAKFNAISRKHTGKDSSYEDYLKFIETILTEVDSAASKTTVSSISAFAAEAVGRKIRNYESKKGTEKPVDVVKFEGEEEEYTPKSHEELAEEAEREIDKL